MNKRYRLVIPEMINKKDAAIAKAFRENDGVEIPLGYETMKSHTMNGIPFNNIPRDWLEEIKEPETQSEIFEECYKNSQADFSDKPVLRNWFNIGWKKRGENERKKHELKCDHEYKILFEEPTGIRLKVCKKCKKEINLCESNRGYEPDNQTEDN